MQLRQFEKRENSKAVWLTDRELDHLLETSDDELHRFALSLMARVQAEVEPLLVMEWGGWSDYEVFRDHYMSIHDPDFQAGERKKVGWL